MCVETEFLTFILVASISFPANRDVSSKCSGNDLGDGGRAVSNNEIMKATETREAVPGSVLADPLGHVQDLQQQLFVPPVLCHSASVQLEGGPLEEGQGFSQRSQLYQVQEV